MISTLKRANWLLRQKICLLLKIEADENDGIFPLEAAPIHLMVCNVPLLKEVLDSLHTSAILQRKRSYF